MKDSIIKRSYRPERTTGISGYPALLKKSVILVLVCLTIFSVSSPLIKASPARASGWAGWDAINTVYYNPAQDDADNQYLEQAATELENYLPQAGKDVTITTTSKPASGSIYLEVDASLPDLAGKNEESFRLLSNSNGIYVTGKTPLAVREGAYTLLEKLGFRWFFKSPIWTIVPDSLIDLNGLNDIEEPDYIWRDLSTEAYNYTQSGIDASEDWNRHNLIFGAYNYPTYHSYASILTAPAILTTRRLTTPILNGFYRPEVTSSYPWQLNPTNPDVMAMAEQYARDYLNSSPTGTILGDGDTRYSRTAPVSPNDGGGFEPPYSNHQDVTDQVFRLANDVAENIKNDYPDALVGLYVYAQYCQIPSFALEPNILAYIATSYNYGDLSLYQQIQGYLAKGIQVGIRDYVDIWGWYKDDWSSSMTIPEYVQFYNALGVKYYIGEAIDNWGGRGLIYYVLSKVLWDSDVNIGDILDDFYTKAFGPAAETMREYYKIMSAADANLAESFRLLDQAETEAVGNEAVLQRIRYMECKHTFIWKRHNVGLSNLNNADLEKLYTLIIKVRDWYALSYAADEEEVSTKLTDRGYTSGQISALVDHTVPSVEYVSGLMDEALATWGNVPGPVTSTTPNPLEISLTAPLVDNLTRSIAAIGELSYFTSSSSAAYDNAYQSRTLIISVYNFSRSALLRFDNHVVPFPYEVVIALHESDTLQYCVITGCFGFRLVQQPE